MFCIICQNHLCQNHFLWCGGLDFWRILITQRIRNWMLYSIATKRQILCIFSLPHVAMAKWGYSNIHQIDSINHMINSLRDPSAIVNTLRCSNSLQNLSNPIPKMILPANDSVVKQNQSNHIRKFRNSDILLMLGRSDRII